jgi:aconitase A
VEAGHHRVQTTGREQVISDYRIRSRKKMTMLVTSPDGTVKRVPLLCRVDTLDELDYFRNGGILPYVLRQLAG